MIKVDIVNEVSKIADITKVKAEVAVDAVFDAMRTSMQRGERIELRGFGVFQVKPRKRGIGRNPLADFPENGEVHNGREHGKDDLEEFHVSRGLTGNSRRPASRPGTAQFSWAFPSGCSRLRPHATRLAWALTLPGSGV